MLKRVFAPCFSLLLFVFLVSCESTGNLKEAVELPSGVSKLVVLHVGDLHGRISPNSASEGGYARLATQIKQERKNAGSKTDVLVIAPGDVVTKGSLVCRNTKDRACLALLKSVGIDIAALGNAELYGGAKGIAQVVKYSNIPWINSNVSTSTNQNWKDGHFYQGEKSGAKVWLFSWLRNPYQGRDKPSLLKNVNIQNQVSQKNWKTWATRSQGDSILWVHHQKWEKDEEFAKAACTQEGLNSAAFISADDHKEALSNEHCAPIAQAAPYAQGLGRLEFKVEQDGKLTFVSQKFLKLDSSVEKDPYVAKQIEKLYRQYAPKALDVIGQLPNGYSQLELADWLARAMKAATHADVAIVNSGAVKTGLEAGEVTREALFIAAPYDNHLLGLDWSFSSLEKALCSSSKRERDPDLDEGSELHLAGGQLIDVGLDSCRLKLDRKRRSLKVAVDSYLLSRSARWLGRDISRVAFRFGFKTENVADRFIKQNGGFR